MVLGTVERIWRYAVKSMTGEMLTSTTITHRGIPGDRGWAVFDETRGGISNAKRLPPLRRCVARYMSDPIAGDEPPPAEVTLPDGTTLRTTDRDAAERMSAYVGRAVTFRHLGPAGSDAAARILPGADSEEFIRGLNGLMPGEPMPDMSAFPAERLRELRQGNFFDALPIHLITRTTLRTLERVAPESIWDERRFRPNLVIETTAADGYPEIEWLGRRARVGNATLSLSDGCPRCVMVTLPLEELPQDHQIMRTLVRETKHTAGIYVGVADPGDVRVGDAIELL